MTDKLCPHISGPRDHGYVLFSFPYTVEVSWVSPPVSEDEQEVVFIKKEIGTKSGVIRYQLLKFS